MLMESVYATTHSHGRSACLNGAGVQQWLTSRPIEPRHVCQPTRPTTKFHPSRLSKQLQPTTAFLAPIITALWSVSRSIFMT
jgi:hypothetical protein